MKTIQFKDYLVFKSPSRVDWKTTEMNAYKLLKEVYPDLNWASLVMTQWELIQRTKNTLKRQGVNRTYAAMTREGD